VILQAREEIKGRIMTENATVCIFTNQTAVARGAETLPRPERLRDDRNKKIKKITSNSATSEGMKVSSPLTSVIQFPDEIEILQNASSYARVVEPIDPVTDTKIR
jgi:hypothetical protein